MLLCVLHGVPKPLTVTALINHILHVTALIIHILHVTALIIHILHMTALINHLLHVTALINHLLHVTALPPHENYPFIIDQSTFHILFVIPGPIYWSKLGFRVPYSLGKWQLHFSAKEHNALLVIVLY